MRDHEVVLSEPVVDEYEAIAGRSAHARYRDNLMAIIAELGRVAVFVEPVDVVFGLRDPDDEIYRRTATAGGAVLITGNTRDFSESRYGSVEIFSPRAFSGSSDLTNDGMWRIRGTSWTLRPRAFRTLRAEHLAGRCGAPGRARQGTGQPVGPATQATASRPASSAVAAA